MKLGVSAFPTGYSMGPAEMAVAAEERGFYSVWFPEHSHIPASRVSPWPGGDDLPSKYWECLDPLVGLGAAAAATTSIKLCTGILLVIQRDPIQVAKEIATLDHISGGRVVFGVGGGWNAEEIANHGTAFKTRFKVMRERIEAMKAIWSEDEAEYHGEFVDFGPIWAQPKPVQKPHPPIIVGGGFPHAARRAVRYGDGWVPIGGRGSDLIELIPQFRDMASEAGRDPDSLDVIIFGADPTDGDSIARARDAGVAEVVFMLPSAPADVMEPLMDQGAKLLAAAAG